MALENVGRGGNSDGKRQSIPDCRSQVTKQSNQIWWKLWNFVRKIFPLSLRIVLLSF